MEQESKSGLNEKEAINSQYAIESNTMIFYDRSISDPIKARKFYKCIDTFNVELYAKVIRASNSLTIRVISIIYDEKQLLDIDLRLNLEMAQLDCHYLGYIVLNNNIGNSILEVMNPRHEETEFYLKNMKVGLGTAINMLNDNRNTMTDPIVDKKDNVGVIPFRRINVFQNKVFCKNSTDNMQFRVLDIYRPAELSRSFNNPPVSSQASWFVSCMSVDEGLEVGSGVMYYLKNPRMVEP